MTHPRTPVPSPTDVLRSFMKEMQAWELRFAERTARCRAGEMDFDDSTRISMAEYKKIFEDHCSMAGSEPRDPCFSEPPDYDPDGESLVSVTDVSPSLVEIETQQTYSHKKRHRFTLVFENGRWVILKRDIVTRNGILDFYL